MVRVLVVEDEERQRDTCVRALTRHGIDVVATATAEEGLTLVQSESFDVVVTDLLLPKMNGVELLQRIRDVDEELGAIVVTGHGTLETAVEALRAGAHDYILKPVLYDELARKIERFVEFRRTKTENIRLRRALQAAQPEAVVTESEAMREVWTWVDRAAQADSTVLITGETGTGKQVVAEAIHTRGPNADEPMLTINVAALPDNMVESELFGHEKGAFTGAEKRRDGMLRATGKGTVFLDEIGELSLPLQAKLLRAIEAREILPVGSDRPVSFNARILCATHRDLDERIKDGRFRQDLFYRLNVVHIDIPPLRERLDDVPPLVHQFLERLAKRLGRVVPTVSKAAMSALRAYSWPGNVRELSNVLERALIVIDGETLEVEHLPGEFRGENEEGVGLALDPAVQAFERSHIAMVLRVSDGNRERAAQELGLSPATLYRKLDKLGLKGFLTGR